jgi:hypothetical protein
MADLRIVEDGGALWVRVLHQRSVGLAMGAAAVAIVAVAGVWGLKDGWGFLLGLLAGGMIYGLMRAPGKVVLWMDHRELRSDYSQEDSGRGVEITRTASEALAHHEEVQFGWRIGSRSGVCVLVGSKPLLVLPELREAESAAVIEAVRRRWPEIG